MTLPTAALELELPHNGDGVVGTDLAVQTRYEDTLAMLAQEYGVGYLEILQANPTVDAWLPGDGTEVTIPTRFVLPDAPREGIVINLPEYRLYYFHPNANVVSTFAIGIGRSDFATPLFESRVVTRIENPAWTPPQSVRAEHRAFGEELPRVVPAGPDNPLGAFAIQLARPGYFIHGTNQPFGVGQRVSHGCIRLYPDDIERLVALSGSGTKVKVIDQPNKVGWLNGELYLESHPRLDGTLDLTGMVRVVIRGTREGDGETPSADLTIDWNEAENIAREGQGLPGRISVK